jgi:pilus assembly protein CpaC
MRGLGAVSVALAALWLGGGAAAQSVTSVEGGVVRTIIETGPVRELVMQENKARILRLDRDARDVLVSNPGIVDVVVKTSRRIYLLGKAVGNTNAFFFDKDGRQILQLDLRVDPDLSPVREALKKLLPRETIEVSNVNRGIALSGTVSSPAMAENARNIAQRFLNDDTPIVNMLATKDLQQVLLKVRIAEMQRSVVKELGINVTIGGPNFQVVSGSGTPAGTFGSVLARIGRIFSLGGSFTNTDVLINALEREGLVKTLAEPNLTAVSGEAAKFLVGGEFPVPTPTRDANVVAITFKEFGVVVTFTPVVLSSGLISLRMTAEVSKLSTEGQIVISGISVPSLTVRRTETTVEMPTGGTLVVAGLLQNDVENKVDGLPFLKDLPILGALFRSQEFSKGETELVITVTPHLIRSVDPDEIALPTDGFAPASDADLYLLGKLHKTYGDPDKLPPAGQLKGPVGYIME